MLYLKRQEKKKKSGKKIFYVENSGQKDLHYFYDTNNVQKTGQDEYNIFLDLAANAAE